MVVCRNHSKTDFFILTSTFSIFLSKARSRSLIANQELT
jgi:hypothetical protein